MEKERLERLKRRRPDLHQQVNTIVLDDDSDEEEQARGAKRQHIASSSSVARRANTRTSTSSSSATTATSSRSASRPAVPTARSNQSQEIFWDGELRQTANRHVIPAKDKRPLFRLSEILSPVSLRRSPVSATITDKSLLYRRKISSLRSSPLIAGIILSCTNSWIAIHLSSQSTTVHQAGLGPWLLHLSLTDSDRIIRRRVHQGRPTELDTCNTLPSRWFRVHAYEGESSCRQRPGHKLVHQSAVRYEIGPLFKRGNPDVADKVVLFSRIEMTPAACSSGSRFETILPWDLEPQVCIFLGD